MALTNGPITSVDLHRVWVVMASPMPRHILTGGVWGNLAVPNAYATKLPEGWTKAITYNNAGI